MKMLYLLIFLDLALIFLSGDVKMKIKLFFMPFLQIFKTLSIVCPFKFCVFFSKD